MSDEDFHLLNPEREEEEIIVVEERTVIVLPRWWWYLWTVTGLAIWVIVAEWLNFPTLAIVFGALFFVYLRRRRP